jgi:hypothetical protein
MEVEFFKKGDFGVIVMKQAAEKQLTICIKLFKNTQIIFSFQTKFPHFDLLF